MKWDNTQIKSVLPQREPFLFIDEVMEIEGADKIVAMKNITGDEDYFKGHFPERPIMPGVLLVEAMAQASILLFSVAKPEIVASRPAYYLGKIKAEFLAMVFPGDRLVIEAHRVKFLDNAAITDTIARVNDQPVARANLVFSIQKNE
jgi:3-hydroxyacyl-[acyl-carrier-protein] dehydratase